MKRGVRNGSAPIGGVAQTVLAGLVLIVMVCCQAVPASARSGKFSPQAKHLVLMDAETGGILFRHKADKVMPPASMSKLMTLAITFKLLKSGKLKLDDTFKMSVNAWRTGGAPSRTAAMFVPIGHTVTLNQLLQGMIVQSGNDAAICLAEGIAGSERQFAKLMTQEARRLGLRKSHFVNATGLPNPKHVMTAYELAVLARHIMIEHANYFHMFSQKEFRYRRHRFFNRNRLLGGEFKIDGMKTGFIKAAGYGIVVSARLGQRRLIAVVAGARSKSARRSEVMRLLNWAKRGIQEFKLYDADEVVSSARVWGGSSFYVPLVGKGEINVWLPKYPVQRRLRGEIIYDSPLKPPIRKGDQVATLRVTSSTSAMQEVPLYAADDVTEGSLVRRGLDSLAHLAWRLLPL